MSVLLLVRHGQASWGSADYDQLSSTGTEQSRVLGRALAYWILDDDDEAYRDLRRQPSHLPGMLSRQEMVDHYTARMGLSVTPEQWRFYEVFGLFRLGVIAQQIYYRYHHGQTTNEAYARFLPMVQLLDERCNRLIDEAAP